MVLQENWLALYQVMLQQDDNSDRIIFTILLPFSAFFQASWRVYFGFVALKQQLHRSDSLFLMLVANGPAVCLSHAWVAWCYVHNAILKPSYYSDLKMTKVQTLFCEHKSEKHSILSPCLSHKHNFVGLESIYMNIDVFTKGDFHGH